MDISIEKKIIAHLDTVGMSVTDLARQMDMNQPHLWMVLSTDGPYKRPLSNSLLQKINTHLGTNFQKETKS